MIISSNCRGKTNYIGSNILIRTDGFRKIVKGLNSKKKLVPNQSIKSHSNLHTSGGLRRISNEQKQECIDREMIKQRKIMTAEKYPNNEYISKRTLEKNDVRAKQLYKYDKQEIANFKKICGLLNI